MGILRHESRACQEALSSVLSVYPYDFASRFALNNEFGSEQPGFKLENIQDVKSGVEKYGTGGTCITLPEIVAEQLETKGLSAKLIADTTRQHVVLCLAGGNDQWIICDPGLLCAEPFIVSPDMQTTDTFVINNPKFSDKTGFEVQYRPDSHIFIMNKKKPSGKNSHYQFDLNELGDLQAVRETNIQSTINANTLIVSKLVLNHYGTASVDFISSRDNARKVKEFAIRNGMDAEELWNRIKIGNRIKRAVKACVVNGREINWLD